MMRLDDVEIKVGLRGNETAAAVQALGLGPVDPWRIYFVEDVTPGLQSSTPLLDRNLIIRARERPGDPDDVTVKLRPGRRSQLSNEWLGITESSSGGLDTELKIEADWAGPRRTLAISLTEDRPSGAVRAAASGGDWSALLTRLQRRFITECSGTQLNLEMLSLLPAISANRWRTFRVQRPTGPDLKVRAERWTIDTLDFLELSIVSDVEDAESAQQDLEGYVTGLGLHPTGESKTGQVIQVLVARAAAT